jgi:Mg-chelatase subunit ChlI
LWHSQGVTFDALVDGDQMIAGEAAPIQERPIRAVEIPLTTPADVLTNEDIVKLIRAGFAEDW